MGYHESEPAKQAQLEPIIARVFDCTAALVGLSLEKTIPSTADADKTRAAAPPQRRRLAEMAESAAATSKRLKDLKIKAPPSLLDIA